MMSSSVSSALLVVLLSQGWTAWTAPLPYHEPSTRPLAAVPDLGRRLISRARSQGFVADGVGDPRLSLPSVQELEAIEKVAQILLMLGEQVIPSILGETSPPAHAPAHAHIRGTASAAPPVRAPNASANVN